MTRNPLTAEAELFALKYEAAMLDLKVRKAKLNHELLKEAATLRAALKSEILNIETALQRMDAPENFNGGTGI